MADAPPRRAPISGPTRPKASELPKERPARAPRGARAKGRTGRHRRTASRGGTRPGSAARNAVGRSRARGARSERIQGHRGAARGTAKALSSLILDAAAAAPGPPGSRLAGPSPGGGGRWPKREEFFGRCNPRRVASRPRRSQTGLHARDGEFRPRVVGWALDAPSAASGRLSCRRPAPPAGGPPPHRPPADPPTIAHARNPPDGRVAPSAAATRIGSAPRSATARQDALRLASAPRRLVPRSLAPIPALARPLEGESDAGGAQRRLPRDIAAARRAVMRA